jgi:hypothetical protein
MQILTGLAIAIAGPSAGYGQAAPQPAQAAAAPGPEEVVKLPKFEVVGHPVDPYNAGDAMSAARTASKILDTPMMINVITPALIQDINPNNLFDVSSYFAGVSPGRGTSSAGINDRQVFRGFESFSRSMDNFTDSRLPYGSAPNDNLDPIFVDHVELIMGPDTILSPSGTPGGTINAITKSPQFTQGTDISAVVGNYNANRLTVDSTGPLGNGQHMAFRVMAAYQDSRVYNEGAEINWAGGAEFTYKFSNTAKFTIKYFGEQQRHGGAACNADLNGEEIYTPDTVGGMTLSDTPQPGFQYSGWNGDASWSVRIVRDNKAEAELTAALGEHINMRLASEVFWSLDSNQMGYPSPTITETFNQQTGQVVSVKPIDPTALPETTVIEHFVSREIHVQNDYAGNFNVGGVSLQPTVGWAYQQGSFPEFWLARTTLPPCNLYAQIYSPPLPPNSAYTVNSGNWPMNGWLMQTYGYLRAGFLNDRVFVSGGAARTWANVNLYSLPYIIEPKFGGINAGVPGPVVLSTFSHTNNVLAPVVQPWADTYMAGILGKVLPNVSVYYNYSTNAQVAAQLAQWQGGVQHEFGIKGNFFNNRISFSVAHFQIKENNVPTQNILYSLGQSTIPNIYSNLVSRGYEVNIVGGITKNLSTIASFTDQKLRDFVGRRPRNTPDNMATLLLDYHFNKRALKNSEVWVGVIHQGDVSGETETGFTSLGVPYQPGFYLAAYTVVNAGAGCQLGNYRFNLNVNNALNKHFWSQAQARSSAQPYPSTTITLTVRRHF